jgi:hypothetical protein
MLAGGEWGLEPIAHNEGVINMGSSNALSF